jgi:DNA repair exonuclease SbcCD ATPase subunit
VTYLVRIRLENFMAFRGEHVLELGPGAYLVTGANYNGKSSLLEAVGWCFFGSSRSRFRSRDAVIHNSEERATVEILLSDGTTVTRTRARGSADLLDVSPEISIESLLGIDHEGYGRLCHLDQGASLALAHATEAHRREVVLGWIGTASRRWDHAAAAVSARVRDLRAELERARGAIDQIRAGGEPASDEERDTLRQALAAAEMEMARARRAMLALDLGGARAAAAARLRAATEALRQAPRNAPSDDQRAEEVQLIEADATTRREAEALGRLARHGFDGSCPITATPCPAAAQVREQQGLIVARASAAATRANHASGARAAAAARRADVARADGHRDLLRREYEVARSSFLEARDRYAALAGDVVPEPAQNWRSIEEEQGAVARALAAQLVRDDRRREDRAALVRLETEVAKLETELAGAVLLARGIAAVPGPIAHAVAQVEASAAAMLDGTGLTMRVTWRRDTAKLVPGCACGFAFAGRQRDCGWCGAERAKEQIPAFDILVDDGDGEDEIRHKSGAAKALAPTALRLAAGAANPELRVGWRILDEGFGELDRERAAMLVRMVQRAATVGVSQVLVVSHDPAMQAAFEQRVVVERAGTSRRIVIP